MKIENSPAVSRKPRSDGRRNRELIVAVAKEAFAVHGGGASLDDIAKRAGVGAGTLYRHFPTREALLGAVYRAEVEKLAQSAEQLSRDLPPVEALSAWLQLFIDHLATKKIIAAALTSLVGGIEVLEDSMAKIREAVTGLYSRAIDAGELRSDVNPADHLRAIVGVTFFGDSEGWRESAFRLAETLIRGSRP